MGNYMHFLGTIASEATYLQSYLIEPFISEVGLDLLPYFVFIHAYSVPSSVLDVLVHLHFLYLPLPSVRPALVTTLVTVLLLFEG